MGWGFVQERRRVRKWCRVAGPEVRCAETKGSDKRKKVRAFFWGQVAADARGLGPVGTLSGREDLSSGSKSGDARVFRGGLADAR